MVTHRPIELEVVTVHRSTAVKTNLVGRDNSDKGKGSSNGRSSVVKRAVDTEDQESVSRNRARPQSYLGFSSTRAISAKGPSSSRDSLQFYSTRYNRGSQIFSGPPEEVFSPGQKLLELLLPE